MIIYLKKYLFITISIFYSLSYLIYSQTKIDSLEFEKPNFTNNKLSTNLDKQLNTYNLNTNIRYITSSGKFTLGFSENFKSSFIKGIENTVRDDHQFNFLLTNSLSELLDFGLRLNNSILSDSRKLEINQASVSSINLFTRVKLIDDKIILFPNFGLTDNRQIGEKDKGFEYGIEARTNKLNLSDFKIDSELKFKNEDIAPRKNLIRFSGFRIFNKFERDIFNFFTFKYSQNRKDFYFPSDSLTSKFFNVKNNIQSRTETQYYVSNKITINEFIRNLSFESEGKLSFRNVEREIKYKLKENTSFYNFNTGVDELRLEIDGTLNYNSEKLNSNLRIVLSERDEKNRIIPFEGMNQIIFEQKKESEEQKNNTSFYGTIIFGTDYSLSKSDKINLNFYQSKLKYDTPSLINDDDRDEILTLIKLEYSKIINPFFSFYITSEGSQSHIVYIFASKSSNNNINRVIKLKTGSDLKTSFLNSTNIFEVSANYTSYDFEDVNSNLKSFSYRQFTALDSTNIILNKRVSLNFSGYIMLSEQGDFSWKSFSEKPKRFLREIFFEPKLVYNFENYYFVCGLRYFNLSTFNYEAKQRLFDSSFLSYGPTSIIAIKIFKELNLNFIGYYEFIKHSNSKSYQQANMNLNINWNF